MFTQILEIFRLVGLAFKKFPDSLKTEKEKKNHFNFVDNHQKF